MPQAVLDVVRDKTRRRMRAPRLHPQRHMVAKAAESTGPRPQRASRRSPRRLEPAASCSRVASNEGIYPTAREHRDLGHRVTRTVRAKALHPA